MESRLLGGHAAINFSQVPSVGWHIISKLLSWRRNKHIKAAAGRGFKTLPAIIGSTVPAQSQRSYFPVLVYLSRLAVSLGGV